MSLTSPKSSNLLIIFVTILLLGAFIFLLLLFFPQSYISSTTNSRLLSAKTAVSQQIKAAYNSITTGHQLIVGFENENGDLGKVKINKTKLKMAKISMLVDKLNELRKPADQIQAISILVTDVPQTRNYAWQDTQGDRIYYSGFSIQELPDAHQLQSIIYLNVPEMNKYGWSSDDIFRELEFLFYLSLLTSNNNTDLESEQKYQEARTIYLEANLDDKVQLFSAE